MGRRLCMGFLGLLLGLLTGCATGPTANPQDPLEPYNRSMFAFNDAVDRTVLKPVATAYRDNVPSLIRQGVNNFFANLEDAWSVVNNLLQFKGAAAAESFMRFNVNTFFGLAGVLDVASEMGMEKHPEDFGQTLGHWGIGPGPYVVLPLLGPSSVRDTVALPVDYKGDLVTRVEDVPVRNSLAGLRIVDTRAKYLGLDKVMEQAALDKYSFTRDAYLQRRRSAVYDGNPPDTGLEE
ncbi:MAG: VacJ family lipoprotein [Gammaproteobacteria bacterium]|nr:VacJ family lipoprotein [Gammaproteobacteria bacterium]MBU0786943.1 VacJ family lipoprotein [Gammaproteobacteria bacterium]MBU0813851.1 VacJ family lipoprotein [Gammaproteobacteria bacterium]MBU1788676.1 VacJ family lipoprotein [Gammaproteobacteria bacterium]